MTFSEQSGYYKPDIKEIKLSPEFNDNSESQIDFKKESTKKSFTR
jgi:hypothetical protein